MIENKNIKILNKKKEDLLENYLFIRSNKQKSVKKEAKVKTKTNYLKSINRYNKVSEIKNNKKYKK